MMRVAVLAAVVGVALASPALAGGGQAWAQPSAGERISKRLQKGAALFADLEYREAVRALAPVVRDPAASRAQRIRALELIGQSQLILGDEVRAREAFQDLLAIDPGYQLRDDTGSPKIREFFDRVKREYVPGFDAGAVAELEFAAPTGATAGRRIEIEVAVKVGADKVKGVLLFTRRRGVLAWSKPVPFRRLAGGAWRARVDAPSSVEGYTLDYYIEARGVADQAVARVAGPETPLTLAVRGRASATTPWWRRWYTVAGGIALIGVTGALIVTSGDSAGDGSLQPGRVTLSP